MKVILMIEPETPYKDGTRMKSNQKKSQPYSCFSCTNNIIAHQKKKI